MNEDICKREIDVHRFDLIEKHFVDFEPCNKPKNPDFLYCEDCMREVFDEKLNSLS